MEGHFTGVRFWADPTLIAKNLQGLSALNFVTSACDSYCNFQPLEDQLTAFLLKTHHTFFPSPYPINGFLKISKSLRPGRMQLSTL